MTDTMTPDYSTWTDSDLVDYFSDYHKDYYGFRPRWDEYKTRDNILAGIKAIDESFNRMLQSEHGRRELLDDGWIIN